MVYFYKDEWIPLMYCSLVDAIQLHHKARLLGKEFFVFPLNLDPNSLQVDEMRLPLTNT
jgi:hypothetical protein